MNMQKLLSVLLLIAVILTIAACAGVNGSGNLINETRQVSNFDKIELSGSGEVIITQSGNESLSIETDDNVLEYVNVEVDGGTLKLGLKSGARSVSPSHLTFIVGVDDLNSLSVSGSGDIESDGLETSSLEVEVSGSGLVQIANLGSDDVKIDISGSGEINMAGDVAGQDVAISGSGKYLAGDLSSKSANVSISGSGDVTVWATESLDADISGSGSIGYYGRPAIDLSGGGSGKINSLGEK
jgi:hypothetical protein